MDTIAIAALPQEERTMAQPIPPLPPKLDDNMVPNCKVKGQPKPIGKKTFNALIVERRTTMKPTIRMKYLIYLKTNWFLLHLIQLQTRGNPKLSVVQNANHQGFL